jgi:DNA-directed RNA polymerase subunit omega
MTSHLLEEAAKVIPSQPVLINLVSRRVRQLGAGHRPLVATEPGMGLSDIAFKEIIEHKITADEPETPNGTTP